MTQTVELNTLLPSSVTLPEYLKPVKVTGLALDSRKVKPGYVFFAVAGHHIDGSRFVADAIDAGAVLCVLEKNAQVDRSLLEKCVFVDDMRHVLACTADRFFCSPSQTLKVIGVTGTNGKSSCVYYLSQLMAALKNKTMWLGTLGYGEHETVLGQTGLTTPDVITMQSILHYAREHQFESVAMEVSSHAIDQGRIDGVSFDVKMLLNITHDHLDYHATFEEYSAVKCRFISQSSALRSVIPLELSSGLATTSDLNFTFSLSDSRADFYVKECVSSLQGSRFSIVTPWGEFATATVLVGSFHVENILACIAALATKDNIEFLCEAINTLKPVDGRLQRVDLKFDNSPAVFVDYAHTPDALERALKALHPFVNGKLWVVFGCGGNRDKNKRPVMGKVARKNADFSVLTSDNPRDENPEKIIDDIQESFSVNAKNVFRNVLRPEAISFAIAGATADDVILVAGKGHEQSQIVGDQIIAMSDVVLAEDALSQRSKAALL